MIDVENLPRLTRKQAVQFLNGRGIPVTANALNEACSKGFGPQASARWGRLYLYEPRELLAWAERRLKPPSASPMLPQDERDPEIPMDARR